MKRYSVGYVVGFIFMALVVLAIVSAVVDVVGTADHRDFCRQMNGRFADGGKYGDDICFGSDGRVVKVW